MQLELRRWFPPTLMVLTLLFCASARVPTSAQALTPEPEGTAAVGLFSASIRDAYLCPLNVVQRSPQRCPPYGPGTRRMRIAYLSARLPDPLPTLPVEPLPAPEGSVTSYVYGEIVNLPAPTYRHPAEAEAGLPPLRTFLSNINWMSVAGTVEYGGKTWVQVNGEEYIEASHVAFPEPSRFQGVALAEQPAYPFAWMRWDVAPSPEPGAAPLAGVTLPRRTLVTVFAVEEIGGHRWDMVAPGQWIDHDTVSQVGVSPRPAGVPAGAKWIEVDIYEQSIAAYEGDRLVYASLITSGKSDLTPLGLFQIFRKARAALMESYDRPMDDEYWYYLEDVEYAQFFNDRISLHAAYWHDYFGNSHSNGCVNLAPLDARWLYAWADLDTWVWVHDAADGGLHKPRER